MTRTVFLLLALALAALPAAADGDRDRDHDRARAALEKGEILPLDDILAVAEAEAAGRVIEVDLERDDGRWIYELELLTPDGRLLEMELDAATGRVLDIEQEDDRDRDWDRDD